MIRPFARSPIGPTLAHRSLAIFATSALLSIASIVSILSSTRPVAAAETANPTATSAPGSATGSPSTTTAPPPSSATAEAQSIPGFSAAALLGIGFNSSKIEQDGGTALDESVGLYGVGVGARVGYTLTSRIYLGATLVYHLGQSNEDKGIKYEGGVLYPGIEAGYELGVGPVIVRPYAGLGYVSVKLKATAGGGEVDASASKVGFWPGATVIYPIDKYFVGADVRYVIVPSIDRGGNANALSLFATGGIHF